MLFPLHASEQDIHDIILRLILHCKSFLSYTLSKIYYLTILIINLQLKNQKCCNATILRTDRWALIKTGKTCGIKSQEEQTKLKSMSPQVLLALAKYPNREERINKLVLITNNIFMSQVCQGIYIELKQKKNK